MKIQPTAIEGVGVVEGAPVADHRGAFMRLYCEKELAPVAGGRPIRQVNFSKTNAVGAIRGMHYQRPPFAEMKLIRCLRGRVWDVAVDIRRGSSTFLQWHAEELTPENGRMIVIPEGCAHGFQVLEADSELLYLHTEFYTPAAEGGLYYADPMLAIPWPLPITDLSARDQAHALLDKSFAGV